MEGKGALMDYKLRSTPEYKNISIEETLTLLNTSAEGLSESEAGSRLNQFGFDEIVEKKENPFLEVLRRYWGPMPWLLELAMVLSLALKHDLEGLIIFVLLTVNAIIGYLHSRGSQKAVELLKK
jgi:H+-transporting ATPase